MIVKEDNNGYVDIRETVEGGRNGANRGLAQDAAINHEEEYIEVALSNATRTVSTAIYASPKSTE